jgi:hypothetical protein
VNGSFERLPAIIVEGLLDPVDLRFDAVQLLADLDQHRMSGENSRR